MSENNNPNTPSEEVSGEESSDDIFSLDDLDDILGEEDSNEANDSGGDTSTTSRPGESLNSESPGESSSSEEKSSSDGSAISKKEIILSKIKLKLAPLLSKWKLLIEYFQKLKTIILKPVEKVSLGLKRFAEKTKLHIVFKFLIQGFSKLKHIFPNAGGIIKRSIAKPLHTIPQLKNKVARLVKSLTRVQVIMLLVGLILFSGIIFLVRESLRSRWIPRIDEPFVTNLLDYGQYRAEEFYQEKVNYEKSLAKEELGFRSGALSPTEQAQLNLRIELSRKEKNLVTDEEKRQYYRYKPLMNSDSERLQFLSVGTMAGRERWAKSRGLEARKDQFDPTTMKLIEQNDIAVGMNEQAVRESWGDPEGIDISGNELYGNQAWRYTKMVASEDGYTKQTRVIYFEAGRVAGWQSY